MMKQQPSQIPLKDGDAGGQKTHHTAKPYFRPAKDDSKPLLQDPILRSDPIQTEEAVLRLPPLPDWVRAKSRGE